MRVDQRFLGWGVFFIVLGGVPLAVQQGLIDRELAARAWQLWPLLIVAAGVGLLLRRTPLEFIGGLLASATVAAMLGGVIAVGADFGGIGEACGASGGEQFAEQRGSLGTTGSVRL